MAVDIALFPLDTMKTVLQSTRADRAKALNLRSMYRGLFSAALGSFPSAATFWLFYEGSKRHLTEATGGEYLPLVHAGSAMLADVAVVGVRNPFEVVKQQMQVGMHDTTGAAVRNIWRTSGVGGFYAGYLGTLVREMPFDAFQFIMYEQLKAMYGERKQAPLVLWENCLLGSCSGACAAAVTTPLDVVKTRLMTQGAVETGAAGSEAAAGAAKVAEEHYKGVVDTLTKVYRKEGAAALFSGVKQRVAWIGFGGAIFIGTFEELKRRFSVLAEP